MIAAAAASAVIIAGIQNDSLFEDLAAELEEGLNLFKMRVSPDLLERGNYFNRAVVDVIVTEPVLVSVAKSAAVTVTECVCPADPWMS